MEQTLKQKSVNGVIWKLLQNSSAQIINFIVSIVLARLLTPGDYGIVAMITVFTSLAMVFINTGFSTAIVQKKNLTDYDKNTIFYSGIVVSIIIYLILYFSAPMIAKFYDEFLLLKLVRAYAVTVIISAFYSVQQALIQREMQFKKSFYISIVGAIVHGIVGILLAYWGYGPWALYYSTVADYMICCIITWYVVGWTPKLIFSSSSLKEMLPFGLKILLTNILNTLFNNISSLAIGKQYSSDQLAFYNKGNQFPALIMQQVDGACIAVMFSSLSKYQDDWETGLRMLRREIKTVMFLCAPLMAGMCAVAEPMILLLLSDKWSGSIVYVRLACILCLFWPLSVKTHALNAIGKSEVSLRNNMIEKVIAIIGLMLTFRINVKAIVVSSIITSLVGACITAVACKKYLDYRYLDQVKDVLHSVVLATIMGIIVYVVPNFIELGLISMLICQVLFGTALYTILSYLFNRENYNYVFNLCLSIIKK